MNLVRRSGLALAGLVVALAAALASAAPAAAAAPASSDDVAYLRLAHLSPDTPNVDVYLAAVDRPDSWTKVPGVGYGTVSDYRAVPADTYTVAMRPAGAPDSSPPVISTTLTTEPGDAYTVAGTGLYKGLGLTVLQDELTPPPAGQARIRVINAAATAPQVDLSIAGGPPIADKVGFAETTGYRTVPTGRWTVEVATPAGGAPATLPIDAASNAVYTVLLLDRGGRLATELHLDSAGAAVPPRGGVETGYGGAAGGWYPLELLLTGGVVGASALLARRLLRTTIR